MSFPAETAQQVPAAEPPQGRADDKTKDVPTSYASERVARALLTAIVEPGDRAAGRAVEQHGACRVLLALRAAASGALGADRHATTLGGMDHARYRPRLQALQPQRVLEAGERAHARFVCPGDLEWPTQLDDLGDTRPLGLWLRGARHLRTAALRSVALVGARACSDYGAYVAAELAASLAERDWTVVSGAAFGIDAAAHRGTLAVGGLTVAVLACGIDVSYPQAHHELLVQVAQEGVVLTEHPPGASPRRHGFIRRNRVLAALTRGVVVVEAALRSGSLSTARSAAELGRHVMGVPGPVTVGASAGVHELLREGGGVLVTSAAEIVEQVGRIGVDLAPAAPGRRRPHDALDQEAALVLDATPARQAASLVRIAQNAGLSEQVTERALRRLSDEGWVRHAQDGWQINRDAPGRMLDAPRRPDDVG